MKFLALLPGLFLILITLNSCCSSCSSGGRFGVAGCEKDHIEVTETEWVEETAYVDSGVKGGAPTPVTTKRPVQKRVLKKVRCTSCGSWFCPGGGCCDTVSTAVLRRATVQGGSGEPHMGQIPTMKVLAPPVQ